MHTNPRPSRYRTSDWRVVPNQTSRSLAAAKNYITVLLKKKKKKIACIRFTRSYFERKPFQTFVCVCALTLSCVVMILMRYIVRWQNRMTFLLRILNVVQLYLICIVTVLVGCPLSQMVTI